VRTSTELLRRSPKSHSAQAGGIQNVLLIRMLGRCVTLGSIDLKTVPPMPMPMPMPKKMIARYLKSSRAAQRPISI
jgi:hypothetical protein